MKNLPQLPDVPEEEQTPLVKSLLALLELYAERIVLLEETIAALKDEINVLKGEKKRPVFKPSGLDKSTDKKSDGAAGGKEKKRAGSKKRSKNAELTIHENVTIAPSTTLPEGSRFKGYRDFVVQDLVITSRNTRYRLERWITPQGETLYGDLKAFKNNPLESDKVGLAQRFDEIFTHKTGFETLNQLLKRIHGNKDELLRVLERPEITLHTNGSETDIRDYVKKRKVSGGTRSDEAQRCRDTFISLKKTCRKLGISFRDFLYDRLCSPEPTIPKMSDLVRERSNAPAF